MTTLAQVRSLLLRIHFYAGIFIAPFILVAAGTGALYAVAPTLESIVYRDAMTASETALSLPLSEQVKIAHDQHPDLQLAQVWPADEPGVTTRVLFDDPNISDDEQRVVFVDPGSGAVKGDMASYSGLGELPLRRWVSATHESLHLGPAGAIYSELAASWLWVLALSGVFLWWRRLKSKKAKEPTALQQKVASPPKKSQLPHASHRASKGTPREGMLLGVPAAKGSRNKALSRHAAAGTWLFVIMIGLSATGLTWSTFAGQNVDDVVSSMGWKASPIATALSTGADGPTSIDTRAEHQESPATDIGAPWSVSIGQTETVLQSARDAGLTGPLRLFSPENSNTAWQASELWVPWRLTSDAVSIDGSNGEVIDRQDFSDLPTFSKLSSWGIYLHMGIMFGLPLQIMLLLTAVGIIFLVIQGYRMWWKRRPVRGDLAKPLGSLTNLGWRIYGVATISAIVIGLFIPLLGISVLCFLAVDIAAFSSQSIKRYAGRYA